MQQHPIPQHVTGYKFHLVGDMTLKQFSELAVGIVLAWIIFSSKMFFLFKWMLGPLTAFFGFALAFIPFEERPLDKWIINFFKSIYAPTQFIFKASPKTLDIFSPLKVASTDSQQSQHLSTQLQDYLKTLPQTPATIFDQSEQKYLDYIKNLFGALDSSSKKLPTVTETELVPVINSQINGVRVRKLHHPQMCLLPHATKPIQSTTTAAMPTKVHPTPTINNNLKTTDLKSTKKSKPSPIVKKTVLIQPKPVVQQKTTPASFTGDYIMPQKPTKPNLISGITLDKNGKIIPNVIIEIRDSKDLPVRALRANKLGQFFIATPLPDGVYQIASEHQDQSFDIIKLEAKGEIIPPIKIQAK